MTNQEQYFIDTFNNKIIDFQLFKKICYTGIPMKFRPRAYQVMLGVIGLDTRKFTETIKAKNDKYLTYFDNIDKLDNIDKIDKIDNIDKISDTPIILNIPNTPIIADTNDRQCSQRINQLSLKNTIANSQNHIKIPLKYKINSKIIHQIHIDILRINPSFKNYNNLNISYIFYNILTITAFKRPYLGYIQGMADLIVPFSNIFFSSPSPLSESEVFFCFNNLLNKIIANIFDLQYLMLIKLEHILSILDPQILNYLRNINLELHMICFRWFSCLFIREFPLNSWYRIFDSMLCSDINDFIVFLGAALVIFFREQILCKDFSNNILFMQNLHKQDLSIESIEALIGNVRFLQKEYYSNCVE